MILNEKSSKALIVGAGSGRDIASAVLLREIVLADCAAVDLAGFLTPWALHSFDGELEKPVNKDFKNPKKFVPLRQDLALDAFFEPILEECIRKYDLTIQNIYLFSLHYGTYTLFEEIEKLIKENSYDTIIVVDVGGDILAEAKDYQTILTPLVDFTCLELFSNLPAPLAIYLVVISPGICGEVRKERLKAMIAEFERMDFFVRRATYTSNSDAYLKFKNVNDEINLRTNSYSHTVHMINEIVQNGGHSNYHGTYRKTYQIDDIKYEVPFNVVIGNEFFNTIYFFDLREVKSIRQDLDMQYHTLLQAFSKVRSMGVCGTEVDLSVVPEKVANRNYLNPIFLLTPCCYLYGEKREAIIKHGITKIRETTNLDYGIILQRDKTYVPSKSSLYIYDIGRNFSLICKKSENENFIKRFPKVR